jgi:hypothetical protein
MMRAKRLFPERLALRYAMHHACAINLDDAHADISVVTFSPNLAFGDQLANGSRDILDQHVVVGPVLM